MLCSTSAYESADNGSFFTYLTQNNMTKFNSSIESQVIDIYRKIDMGKLQEAGHACERVVQENPEYGPAWLAFSELWLACGEIEKAGACASQATQIEPDSIPYNLQLAKCYLFYGDDLKALMVARKALGLKPESARDLDTLGNIFSRCGQHTIALQLFERAINLNPGDTNTLFNFASSLVIFGEAEQAESIFDQIIKHNPADFRAYYQRSLIRRQTRENNHIHQIQAALETNMSPNSKIALKFALAKELEDIEEYEASFNALRQAANLKHEKINYRLRADTQAMDKMIDSTESLASGSDAIDSSLTPIFIAGLPRTGTSLVEKILAAHDDVVPGGELRDFEFVLKKQLPANSTVNLLERIADHVDDFDYEKIGQEYMDRVNYRISTEHVFTDKMPINALYAGLIHRALPRAKIIVIQRNPMDSCYSMYKHLFAGRRFPFSYNLKALGEYFIAFQKLISHWKSIIPSSNMLIFSYESLIGNPQYSIQSLLKFCNLNWQDRCLDFYKEKSPVATPSAMQVNQPLYKHSVDRWKCYRDQLSELERMLLSNNAPDF